MCGQFNEFPDADGFMELHLVRVRHHNGTASATRGCDECRLAHQAQRGPAEQRAVVVGLIGKNQLDKTGRFERAYGRLEGGLHREYPLALQLYSKFAISAYPKPCIVLIMQ